MSKKSDFGTEWMAIEVCYSPDTCPTCVRGLEMTAEIPRKGGRSMMAREEDFQNVRTPEVTAEKGTLEGT